VFFTPGSTAPKLGIDLQGGTRVTLLAKTTDGSTPSRDSMKLARTIMERRVNGSGVAGAQIQIDGSNQLVITVPGQDNLEGLTRSAQLNIRPVIAQWVNPAMAQIVSPETSATPTTAATGTADATATPTTGATATSQGPATATAEPQSAASTATTTAESGQGLRAGQAAIAPREGTTSGQATES